MEEEVHPCNLVVGYLYNPGEEDQVYHLRNQEVGAG